MLALLQGAGGHASAPVEQGARKRERERERREGERDTGTDLQEADFVAWQSVHCYTNVGLVTHSLHANKASDL